MFHGQTANLDKLYHDGQAGDRPFVLDISKIPGFDIYLFRQVFSCEMLCFPRDLYVRTESFKTGAIFDFCHIASPTYILYFIVCLCNVAICACSKLYISYYRLSNISELNSFCYHLNGRANLQFFKNMLQMI